MADCSSGVLQKLAQAQFACLQTLDAMLHRILRHQLHLGKGTAAPWHCSPHADTGGYTLLHAKRPLTLAEVAVCAVICGIYARCRGSVVECLGLGRPGLIVPGLLQGVHVGN